MKLLADLKDTFFPEDDNLEKGKVLPYGVFKDGGVKIFNLSPEQIKQVDNGTLEINDLPIFDEEDIQGFTEEQIQQKLIAR